MLYELKDATVSVGGEEILSHVDFFVKGNEKIAIVGRNGAGKTTLLRVLSGELLPDRDDRRNVPAVSMSRAVTIGMLSQQVFSDADQTVEEELLSGYYETGNQQDTVKSSDAGKPSDSTIISENTDYQRERFLYECEYDRLLTGFGFEKDDKQRKISQFSGGQQTKLAFIRLLLKKPDILLLDEPTNHLDMETIEWLEDYLISYPKAVVMVSHDRFFLDQVASVVYEVTDKSLVRYAGNYTAYKEEKIKTQLRLKKQNEQLAAERKRLDELILKFKNKPKKAAMARAKKKQLERMAVPENITCEKLIRFTEPISPLVLGAKWVYEAEHLQVGYDKPLFETSLRIRRGQKIGVIGANGTGKSTLLKTIAGLLPPIKGKNTLGNQILLGYFDQKSGEISSEKTVLEHFTELFPGLTDKEARQVLSSWLFSGAHAGRSVNALSGGEKARLVMAELLYSKPNFLILDEPTNHMDIQAKEVLEEAFAAYTGTMLFVSHDRYLINKVADALLIIKNGEVYYYPFSYQHYLSHIERGEETPPGQMKAEDAALIASLKAVPKRGSLLGHEMTTEESYLDWQMGLLDRECEEAHSRFISRMQEACDISSQTAIFDDFTEQLIQLDLRRQEILSPRPH